jgi:hypothetical protein
MVYMSFFFFLPVFYAFCLGFRLPSRSGFEAPNQGIETTGVNNPSRNIKQHKNTNLCREATCDVSLSFTRKTKKKKK